ncbi:MAG: hypothetical protein Q7S21_01020 [archaeon]|nr:hypothetical protein [archaeon]
MLPRRTFRTGKKRFILRKGKSLRNLEQRKLILYFKRLGLSETQAFRKYKKGGNRGWPDITPLYRRLKRKGLLHKISSERLCIKEGIIGILAQSLNMCGINVHFKNLGYNWVLNFVQIDIDILSGKMGLVGLSMSPNGKIDVKQITPNDLQQQDDELAAVIYFRKAMIENKKFAINEIENYWNERLKERGQV